MKISWQCKISESTKFARVIADKLGFPATSKNQKYTILAFDGPFDGAVLRCNNEDGNCVQGVDPVEIPKDAFLDYESPNKMNSAAVKEGLELLSKFHDDLLRFANNL